MGKPQENKRRNPFGSTASMGVPRIHRIERECDRQSAEPSASAPVAEPQSAPPEQRQAHAQREFQNDRIAPEGERDIAADRPAC